MLSMMHLPLIKADWEPLTRKFITLPSLLASNLEIILQEEFTRLTGRKSDTFSAELILAVRAMWT